MHARNQICQPPELPQTPSPPVALRPAQYPPSGRKDPSATAFSTAKIDSPGKAACKCSTRPLTKGAFDKSLHQEPRALHSGMPWVKLPTDLEVRHGTAKPKRRTDAKCTILLKSTSACFQRLRAQTAVLATVFCFECSSIQSWRTRRNCRRCPGDAVLF